MAGSSLYFAAAGAVMTDMALALGMTLAMRGFWLALHGLPAVRLREQFLMFLGLAIGLLAKGPIALILAAIPIAIWTLRAGEGKKVWREIHWGRGLVFTLAIAAPWYFWAEARTPGFLQYFIVGEHWHRFVNPGWQGDLYGSSHAFPHGTIWLFAILATLPWSFMAFVAAWKWRRVVAPVTTGDRSLAGYLLAWALSPCIFFTGAGNILWTYVLPGVPAFSMLAALWLNRLPDQTSPRRWLAGGVALTAVASLGIVAGFNLGGWNDRKSTKALVGDFKSLRADDSFLVFFRVQPASGAFYSRGRAEMAPSVHDLERRLARGTAFIAIKNRHLERVPDALMSRIRPVSQRGEYRLYVDSSKPESGIAGTGKMAPRARMGSPANDEQLRAESSVPQDSPRSDDPRRDAAAAGHGSGH